MLDREPSAGVIVRSDRQVPRVLRGHIGVDHGHRELTPEGRPGISGPADDDDAIDAAGQQGLEMVLLADHVAAGVTEEHIDLACTEGVLGSHEDGDDETALEVAGEKPHSSGPAGEKTPGDLVGSEPRCEGTGQVVLDVQFLPDVDIPCPDCGGSRYAPAAHEIRRPMAGRAALSLPALLALTVRQASDAVDNLPKVRKKLQNLVDLGLGYLTLGEDTPALSGGEAQRLKLAAELGRDQSDSLFVLDEPSIGLHPLDVRVLLGVIERLLSKGATVILIEHDLDLIANADYIIDMGPGGGMAGGRIVASGTPEQVAGSAESATAPYLLAHLSGRI